MRVVIVNYHDDRIFSTPEALLTRYVTLTGWADALRRAGAEHVTVAQSYRENVDLLRGDVRYVLRSRRSLLHDAIAHERPDVVHVNGLIYARFAVALRRQLRPTTAVVFQHHAETVPRSKPGRWRLRAGLKLTDAFLFTAAAQAAPWRASGLINADQLIAEVLESGTDMPCIAREEARARSGVTGHPAVLWVGRLNRNKDPLTVLEGFRRALGDLPDARLTMIYYEQAELLDEVRWALAGHPELAAKVDLVSTVPHGEMPAFFSAADLFSLGSHREGSGYALMEALRSGVIPVVTDIPSFRALTNDGRLGHLWCVGDPEAYAHALQRAAKTDFMSRRAAIRQYAAKHVSWSAVGTAALHAYEAALAHAKEARSAVRVSA
jgi:glycosyltransferase involved in cell wall biosynthesis